MTAHPAVTVDVTTTAGTVRGRSAHGAWGFRGIPYGESTAGAARFLPPREKQPWQGVLEAFRFGPRAPQTKHEILMPSVLLGEREEKGGESEGEDCLVLNVYTPEPGGRSDRPVLFWMHGGGYASGSGGPGFESEHLARLHDVVIVTINHRLNVFGFLDLSEFDDRYRHSGNAGSLDIALALRWVRDNIAAFGGDPGNVTIFGYSGGGAKVSNTMAMTATRGLYHQAIVQSGAVLRSLEQHEARDLTRRLLAELGIDGDPIPQLQQLPAERLLQAMDAIGATGNPKATSLNFSPCVDGDVIPHHPGDPETLEALRDIPVMVGFTREDTRAFYIHNPDFEESERAVTVSETARQLRIGADEAEALVAAADAANPGMTPAELYVEVTTQYMFGLSSWQLAERRASLGAPTWLYRVDWHRPGAEGARVGAGHGIDVRLIFDPLPEARDDESRELREMGELFQEVWMTFARTGRPGAASLPDWPEYAGGGEAMILERDPRSEGIPSADLRAWSELLPAFHP